MSSNNEQPYQQLQDKNSYVSAKGPAAAVVGADPSSSVVNKQEEDRFPAVARIIKSPYFNAAIYLLIVVNLITVSARNFPSTVRMTSAFDIVDDVSGFLYLIEALVKIAVLGPKLAYFKNPWNIFDFSVVVVSMVGFGLERSGVSAAIGFVGVARIVRLVRLLSISHKIRLLFAMLTNSAKRLLNVVMLLILFLFLITLLAQEFFEASLSRRCHPVEDVLNIIAGTRGRPIDLLEMEEEHTCRYSSFPYEIDEIISAFIEEKRAIYNVSKIGLHQFSGVQQEKAGGRGEGIEQEGRTRGGGREMFVDRVYSSTVKRSSGGAVGMSRAMGGAVKSESDSDLRELKWRMKRTTTTTPRGRKGRSATRKKRNSLMTIESGEGDGSNIVAANSFTSSSYDGYNGYSIRQQEVNEKEEDREEKEGKEEVPPYNSSTYRKLAHYFANITVDELRYEILYRNNIDRYGRRGEFLKYIVEHPSLLNEDLGDDVEVPRYRPNKSKTIKSTGDLKGSLLLQLTVDSLDRRSFETNITEEEATLTTSTTTAPPEDEEDNEDGPALLVRDISTGRLSGQYVCPYNYLCIRSRSDEKDKTNFGTTTRTFATLYNVMTMEAWTGLLYPVIESQGVVIAALFFALLIFVGNFFLLNLTLVVILDAFEKSAVLAELVKKTVEETVVEQPPPILPPAQSVDPQELTTRPVTALHPSVTARGEDTSTTTTTTTTPSLLISIQFEEEENGRESTRLASPKTPQAQGTSQRSSAISIGGGGGVARPILKSSSSYSANGNSDHKMSHSRAITFAPLPYSDRQRWFGQYRKFKLVCEFIYSEIVGTATFRTISTLVLLFNLVVETTAHAGMRASHEDFIAKANVGVTIWYIFEVVMKFLAYPFPIWRRDPFNIFDSVITLISTVELIFIKTSTLSILRTMRFLKVVSLSSSLRLTLATLVAAFKGSFPILALVFLFIFLFSVIGIQLFAKKFCGEFYGAPLVAYEDYLKVGTVFCENVPRGNFDNIGYAFQSVFIVSSGEGWRDIMTTTSAAAGDLLSSAFFVLAHFVLGYIMVNLFVAIIINSATELKVQQAEMLQRLEEEEEAENQRRLLEIQEKQKKQKGKGKGNNSDESDVDFDSLPPLSITRGEVSETTRRGKDATAVSSSLSAEAKRENNEDNGDKFTTTSTTVVGLAPTSYERTNSWNEIRRARQLSAGPRQAADVDAPPRSRGQRRGSSSDHHNQNEHNSSSYRNNDDGSESDNGTARVGRLFSAVRKAAAAGVELIANPESNSTALRSYKDAHYSHTRADTLDDEKDEGKGEANITINMAHVLTPRGGTRRTRRRSFSADGGVDVRENDEGGYVADCPVNEKEVARHRYHRDSDSDYDDNNGSESTVPPSPPFTALGNPPSSVVPKIIPMLNFSLLRPPPPSSSPTCTLIRDENAGDKKEEEGNNDNSASSAAIESKKGGGGGGGTLLPSGGGGVSNVIYSITNAERQLRRAATSKNADSDEYVIDKSKMHNAGYSSSASSSSRGSSSSTSSSSSSSTSTASSAATFSSQTRRRFLRGDMKSSSMNSLVEYEDENRRDSISSHTSISERQEGILVQNSDHKTSSNKNNIPEKKDSEGRAQQQQQRDTSNATATTNTNTSLPPISYLRLVRQLCAWFCLSPFLFVLVSLASIAGIVYQFLWRPTLHPDHAVNGAGRFLDIVILCVYGVEAGAKMGYFGVSKPRWAKKLGIILRKVCCSKCCGGARGSSGGKRKTKYRPSDRDDLDASLLGPPSSLNEFGVEMESAAKMTNTNAKKKKTSKLASSSSKGAADHALAGRHSKNPLIRGLSAIPLPSRKSYSYFASRWHCLELICLVAAIANVTAAEVRACITDGRQVVRPVTGPTAENKPTNESTAYRTEKGYDYVVHAAVDTYSHTHNYRYTSENNSKSLLLEPEHDVDHYYVTSPPLITFASRKSAKQAHKALWNVVVWSRVVRNLRLWSFIRFSSSATILCKALLRSLTTLRNAAIITALFWYLYSVLGLMLFRGKLNACTSFDIVPIDEAIALLSGSGSRRDGIEGKTFWRNVSVADIVTIYPERYSNSNSTYNVNGTTYFYGEFAIGAHGDWGDMSFGPARLTGKRACLDAGYLWLPFPLYNFDNIGSAMLAMFQEATVSDWLTLMFVCTDSVSESESPRPNSNLIAPVYFVTFIVIMGQFLINFIKSALIDGYFSTKGDIEEEYAELRKAKEEAAAERRAAREQKRRAALERRRKLEMRRRWQNAAWGATARLASSVPTPPQSESAGESFGDDSQQVKEVRGAGDHSTINPLLASPLLLMKLRQMKEDDEKTQLRQGSTAVAVGDDEENRRNSNGGDIATPSHLQFDASGSFCFGLGLGAYDNGCVEVAAEPRWDDEFASTLTEHTTPQQRIGKKRFGKDNESGERASDDDADGEEKEKVGRKKDDEGTDGASGNELFQQISSSQSSAGTYGMLQMNASSSFTAQQLELEQKERPWWWFSELSAQQYQSYASSSDRRNSNRDFVNAELRRAHGSGIGFLDRLLEKVGVQPKQKKKIDQFMMMLTSEERYFFQLYRYALYFVRPPLVVSYTRESSPIRFALRRLMRSRILEYGQCIFAFVHIIAISTMDWPTVDENVRAVSTIYLHRERDAITSSAMIVYIGIDMGCTAVFVLIMLCKAIVYGIKPYLSAKRNWFDILINVATAVGCIFCVVAPGSVFWTSTRLLLFMRVLRIHYLFFVDRSLLVQLQIMLDSGKNFVAVLMLMFLLMTVFASVGLILFGNVVYTNRTGFHAYAGFGSFAVALATLFRVSTGDDWGSLMASAATESPNCSVQLANCGNPVVATIYFCLFVMLGAWIALNLFTAVLMEGLVAAESDDQFPIQEADVRQFQRAWKSLARHDPVRVTLTMDELQLLIVLLNNRTLGLNSHFKNFKGALPLKRSTAAETEMKIAEARRQGMGTRSALLAANEKIPSSAVNFTGDRVTLAPAKQSEREDDDEGTLRGEKLEVETTARSPISREVNNVSASPTDSSAAPASVPSEQQVPQTQRQEESQLVGVVSAARVLMQLSTVPVYAFTRRRQVPHHNHSTVSRPDKNDNDLNFRGKKFHNSNNSGKGVAAAKSRRDNSDIIDLFEFGALPLLHTVTEEGAKSGISIHNFVYPDDVFDALVRLHFGSTIPMSAEQILRVQRIERFRKDRLKKLAVPPMSGLTPVCGFGGSNDNNKSGVVPSCNDDGVEDGRRAQRATTVHLRPTPDEGSPPPPPSWKPVKITNVALLMATLLLQRRWRLRRARETIRGK